MTSAKILGQWDKKYLWHPFTQQAEWNKEEPTIVQSARGVRLKDQHGREYIDGVSSLWVTVHGHREPALDRAVRRQLGRVAHSTFLGLTHEPAIRLGKALADIAPKGLSRVFYSDNGATAVEVALKMAFQYRVHTEGPSTRRREYLALSHSYHGDTLGAVSVGGIAHFQKVFRPLLFRARFAPAPHCDRCPFRKKPSTPRLRTGDERVRGPAPRPGDFRAETGCRWECLSGAEKILKERRSRLVAAIVEPLVQAAVGLWIMPPGYLRGFARLCRKYAVPLIADEVATGFGRTGTMFAVQQEGVVPDFLCVAKSLTGGYLPLAATLTSDKIFRAFLGRYDQFKSFFHGHTYTANPLACAVALENLRLLQKKNWPRALVPLRRDLTLFLKEIGNHPRVGHVRQMGLMAGIELVADRKTGRRFPPGDRVGYRVCQAARKRGLWIRPLGDTLVILPPLGIGRVDLHRLTEAVRGALGEVLPPGDGTSFC